MVGDAAYEVVPVSFFTSSQTVIPQADLFTQFLLLLHRQHLQHLAYNLRCFLICRQKLLALLAFLLDTIILV